MILPSRREQVDVGVDIVVGGDAVEDEVEAAGVLLHLVGVLGDDDFVRAEAERVLLLARRGGEDDGVRAERVGELHSHVAEAAEADDADLLALADAPMAHRRVSRDAGAEQRRGAGEVEVGRDAQDEAFVHDNAVGVAAVGDRRRPVLVGRAVGEHLIRAELLEAGLAIRAGVVRIDQAADAHQVARL